MRKCQSDSFTQYSWNELSAGHGLIAGHQKAQRLEDNSGNPADGDRFRAWRLLGKPGLKHDLKCNGPVEESPCYAEYPCVWRGDPATAGLTAA